MYFEGLTHLKRSMGPRFFSDVDDGLAFCLLVGDSPNSPNSTGIEGD